MAVAGINKLSKIKSINACTYQAASGAGQAGMKELDDQMAKSLWSKPLRPRLP